MNKLTSIIFGVFLIFHTNAHALETVSLQLKWTHQFQFAGYYMAKAKGFYQEVGLNVNFIEGDHSLNSVTEVLAGRANFGIGGSNLLLERNTGKPLVVLGVIFQHSPYVLLMRQTSPIQSIHNLVGKRLVIEEQAEELLAYLKKEGVSPEQIKLIHLNPEAHDLIANRADAISAYVTDEPDVLDHLNVPYLIFSPRSVGIDFYGDNFFTTETEIATHPERVKAFRDATIRGWQYAMAHTDEAIELIRTEYAPYKSKTHLEYEAKVMQSLILPSSIEMGYMFEGRWRHILKTYADLNMLPADMSLEGFLYVPSPPPFFNYRIIGFMVIAACVIVTVAMVALRFFRLNQKLDKLLYIRNQHTNLGESMDNISHQWKQPLNELGVHMMLIETMLQKDSCDEARHEIQKVVQKSHHILEFMADSIDVFRHFVSSNQKISRFDPALLILDTLQLVTENFTMETIVITHNLTKGMFVLGNSTEFSQVLLSLLVNAKDTFNERNVKNPNIHICLLKNLNNVVLTISDNAGGILIKPIKRIFNVGVSGKKNSESGLGLYISKNIIEKKMGGTIHAENRGEGAMFKITLPISDS